VGAQEPIVLAAETAARALGATAPHKDLLLRSLSALHLSLMGRKLRVPKSARGQVREVLSRFRVHHNAVLSVLGGEVLSATEALSEGFDTIDREQRFVTLTVFGRTRAGKSTLIEALTAGDGGSIGTGGQHTTRTTRPCYFPGVPGGGAPAGPCLRIVDTPGIEGFSGEELARMAEHFVGRSDHILFLLSDDKESSGELDRFGLIRSEGKGITAILNVKTREDDLDLLALSPGLVFQERELEGHRRRISGYIAAHFEMDAPEIIPVHARAAWLGLSGGPLPEGVSSHDQLVRQSRIGEVHDFIAGFVREKAVPARRRAPRDLMHTCLETLHEELGPRASEFMSLGRQAEELRTVIRSAAERFENDAVRRVRSVTAVYEKVEVEIPDLVDRVILEGGRGEDLRSGWKALLRACGATSAVRDFVREAQRDLAELTSEEIRVAVADMRYARTVDAERLLGECAESGERFRNAKYARAALRVGAGLGGAFLATGIANLWNPAGWVIVGVAAAGGYICQRMARGITDELERAGRKELVEKRAAVVEELRERARENCARAEALCRQKASEMRALCEGEADQMLSPMADACRRIGADVGNFLAEALRTGREMDHELVCETAEAIIPEAAEGRVRLERVSRVPGYVVGVMVSAAPGDKVNPMGACIGAGGCRAARFREAMGGERVAFVNAGASPEDQVRQALGLGGVRGVEVGFRAGMEGRRPVAEVLIPADRMSAAIGPRGAHVRMAGNLLRMKIECKKEG